MRKKRKTRVGEGEPAEPKAPAPVAIGSQLEHALRSAGLEKLPDKRAAKSKATPRPAAAPRTPPAASQSQPAPHPSPAAPERPRSPYTAGELAALGDAYRGARPLKRKSPVLRRVGPRPEPRAIDPTSPASPASLAADREARDRLGALIAGDVRFDVQLEPDGYVQALRQGAARKLLAAVQGSAFAPDATLDLHGLHAPEAARRVHDFVRSEHRRGARRLLIIVGKGNHSEDGTSVLGPVAREALTRGGAAPLVQAFASAHATLGGRGALAVLLR